MTLSSRCRKSFGEQSPKADRVACHLFPTLFRYCCFFAGAFTCVYGQQGADPAESRQDGGLPVGGSPGNSHLNIDKRAFGFIPNYGTADASLPYQSISPKQKMAITAKDSLDWTLFLVAAGYAGLGQLTDQNPPLGQGLKGYANRFVRNYADQVMGNMVAEGVMPILLHQDPRYFRRGQGTFWRRVEYAASRVLVTRIDSGGTQFNYSEVLGNSVAVGISNAYYPGSRNLGGNIQKFTLQLATDAVTNVLKEFWPDAKRKLPLPRPGN
jgi:hypothetical protein